ncbi:nucleosome-remodeling factor subunit NURF301 E(bx) [Dermatophagoides farinae]|uniref:nucleosome-remodeling factor subunit NURF301 E(bx) n=1 Tax=Dermatophagoides farinae TaxID=6954 RepID=UPI003F5EF1B6
MRKSRPRKRGRPPKNQSNNNNKYLNTKINKVIIDDDDDEDSNHSSSTTNTSRSSGTNNKYQTRSTRRSSTRSSSTVVELTKKRGRKRKKTESEDELCDDEYYYDEPATQSDEDVDDSDKDDDDDDDDDVDVDDDKDDENEIDEFEEEQELEEESEEEEGTEQTGKRRGRPPREKAPVYLDDQEVPELSLPSSSEDLLISGNELIRTLSIYEILRHFSNTLRLSPFRFEDFCISLLIDEQTYLLSEIHIQLLKALIREDDLIGTQHGPQDIRDSINVYLHLCDHVTWPEVLKIYLSSDYKKNKPIMDQSLMNDTYPFTSVDKKLILLQHLCDDFLNTQVVRDAINSEGKLDHDEHCRSCHKNGEMLMCDSCPAVFHLSCLDPPLKQVPEQEWFCPICKQNQVMGVTDCVNEYERQMPRQEPIGWDRHGRQYWFLARRIIVEDTKSDKVWYYTTRLQFDELLECIDDEMYESDLCKTLSELHDDIYKQMGITEKLTKIAKGSRKSYLEVVNEELYLKRSSKIKSNSTDDQSVIGEKIAELETKLAVDEEDLRGAGAGGGGMQTRLKTGTLPQKSFTMTTNYLRNQTSLYNTIQAFRDEETVIVVADNEKTLTRTQRRALPATYFEVNLFNLGFEGNYRNYQNIYSLIPMALSRNQVQDDRDRRRHLSHKFSLTPMSDLKWASYNQVITAAPVTTAHGPKPMLINTLRQALLQFELNFPNPLMHSNWKRHRDNWIKAVKICSEPREFGLALYILESSMKPVLFNNAWNDLLGFTVLQRTTQLERDELKKKEKKSGRSAAAAASAMAIEVAELMSSMLDPNDSSTASKYNPLGGGAGVKLVNGKLRHQIWKQKGEEYRLSGVGGWFWLTSIRNPYKVVKCDLEKNLSLTPNVDDDVVMKESESDDNNNNQNEEIKTEKIDENSTMKTDDDDDDGNDENFIVKISEFLTEKTSKKRKFYYPKIFQESRLDKLLSCRMNQLTFERKQKKENDDVDDEKKNDVLIKPLKSTQPPVSITSCCYSISCDSNSSTVLPSSCSSPVENGHHNCYSPLCSYLAKNQNLINGNCCSSIKKEEMIFKDLTESVELQKIITVDDVEQFAKKVVSFTSKAQLPPSTRFTNGKFKSIFIPLDYELRQLGRTGGQYEISGFNYNAKINPSIWPYGLTPRPSFRITWLFRVYNLPTLHCVALQLRVLWASVRWDDLAQKPPISGTNTITTDVDVQTIEILKRRDMPPFGLRSEYHIRKITVPIDVPIYRSREIPTPNRSGLRERRRPESPQNRGPRMDENWVREEELEIWEIKQFNDKQIHLARQKAIQEQRQKELEMKRKLQETGSVHNKTSIDTVRFVNGGNINLHPNTATSFGKTLTAKFSTLITNRVSPKCSNTSSNSSTQSTTHHPTIATLNTSLPYGSTIHTSNGQAIRLQTTNVTKPSSSQLFIRDGNNFQLLTSTASPVTANNRTYILRTPLNSTGGGSTVTTNTTTTTTTGRPIFISNNFNTTTSPIIRSVNTIQHSNIRHSIPIIATNCPKKISTATTVNAILTTNTLKNVITTTTATTVTTTATVTATATSSSSSSSSSPVLSAINVTNSKNITCLPLKLSDGRTHYLPLSSLSTAAASASGTGTASGGGVGTNQTVQISLNSNNQIRFITTKPIINASNSPSAVGLRSNNSTIVTGGGGDNNNNNQSQSQPKAIFVATSGNNAMLAPTTTPLNTIVLTNANNQKVILHSAATSAATATPTTLNQMGIKTIQIGGGNNQSTARILTKSPIIVRNPNVVTTGQQTDPIPASTLSKANVINSNTSSSNLQNKESEEKDFVVTAEMTQDIVRKALMNPNVAPEIAQKLLALQKHHQEQADSPNYQQQFNQQHQQQSLPNKNEYTTSNHRISQRSSSLSTTTRSSRYSRSKYDNDGDYIYEYPQPERHSRTPRPVRDEKEDTERICSNVIKQMIDKIEKEIRSNKHKEVMAERKHKKNMQMKIKFRQNHIEVIRRNILRRKSVFNQHIKCMVEREIDEKLKQAQRKLAAAHAKSSLVKTASSSSSNQTVTTVNQSNNVKLTISGVKHKLDSKDFDSNNKSNNNSSSTETPESESRSIKRQRLANTSGSKSSSSPSSSSNVDSQSTVNNVAAAKSPHHQTQKKSPKSKTATNYCICNRTDDKSMMIACDDCGRWYHIKCIGMDKQEADDLEQYFCLDCKDRNPKLNDDQSKKSNSLSNNNSKSSPRSTTVTTTPTTTNVRKSGPGRKPKHHHHHNRSTATNNNSNDNHKVVIEHEDDDKEYCFCKEKYESEKFYICCDQCNDWFHGRCVGVTCIRADQIDEYFCPRCQGEESRSYRNIQPLVDGDFQRMEKIVKTVKSHRSSWPFLKPVDGKQVPDYYTVIKEPMDLQQISNRISGRNYKRFTEFIYDMHKIFDNCRYYNEPSSQYCFFANTLEEVFERKLRELKD